MTHCPERYPDAPGFKENTTSKDAADAIAPSAARMRASVLNFLDAWWPSGFTADQIASELGLSILSVRPRVSELNRLGEIEPTGERRKNESGSSAHVWRVSKTPSGSAMTPQPESSIHVPGSEVASNE